MKKSKTLPSLMISALIGLSAGTCAATADLTELSIDQLMNMEITTASKKEQKLSETASAVFVLSDDDIKRSGATTLPELLLMVPGIDGGAINSHSAAVGIRGLGGQWSNKLLVLIDGRSVYTRTFSGVYWDSYNIPFEDIERIEVIRGANAALWGANAVNGVINIITRSSGATQGTLVRGSLGSNSGGDALARQGFKLGEQGHARVYASGERHGDSADHRGGDADDEWKSYRTGFRTDWDTAAGIRLMAQGDAYHVSKDNNPLDASSLPTQVVPIGVAIEPHSTMHGHSLQLSMTNAYALTSAWSLQVSWSHADRDEFIPLSEDAYDFDFQHRLQPLEGHDLVWGANMRYRRDNSSPSAFIAFEPEDASDTNASLFFQDEIALLDNRVRVALGARLEHDEHNDWEFQPSLRALWNIDANHKVWAALSRAARTPSRVDRDVAADIPLVFDLPPFGPVPATLQLRGNKEFKTETMLSYELGYRVRTTATTSLDLALYHNDYENLRTVEFDGIVSGAAGIQILAPMGNSMNGQIWGGELVGTWTPAANLRLQLFWAELRANLQDASTWTTYTLSQNYSHATPERQVGLRSDWDITAAWSASVQLKYVAELSFPFNSLLLEDGKVPAYVDMDVNLGWQFAPHVRLALLGKNLLDHSRLEYSSESGAKPTETRRAAYVRATWSF